MNKYNKQTLIIKKNYNQSQKKEGRKITVWAARIV